MPSEEKAVERIARAHPHRLLEMAYGFLGLAVENQRKADIAVGGGEVRIEIERRLEMTDRLIGLAAGQGEIAERHVRPRIAVVEFDRAMGKMRGKFPIACQPVSIPRRLRPEARKPTCCAPARSSDGAARPAAGS